MSNQPVRHRATRLNHTKTLWMQLYVYKVDGRFFTSLECVHVDETKVLAVVTLLKKPWARNHPPRHASRVPDACPYHPPIRASMVRPVICYMGTRGNVQPFIALALGLAAADDEPLLLVPPEYLSWVEEYGVEVQGYTGSVQVPLSTTSQHSRRALTFACSHDVCCTVCRPQAHRGSEQSTTQRCTGVDAHNRRWASHAARQPKRAHGSHWAAVSVALCVMVRHGACGHGEGIAHRAQAARDGGVGSAASRRRALADSMALACRRGCHSCTVQHATAQGVSCLLFTCVDRVALTALTCSTHLRALYLLHATIHRCTLCISYPVKAPANLRNRLQWLPGALP